MKQQYIEHDTDNHLATHVVDINTTNRGDGYGSLCTNKKSHEILLANLENHRLKLDKIWKQQVGAALSLINLSNEQKDSTDENQKLAEVVFKVKLENTSLKDNLEIYREEISSLKKEQEKVVASKDKTINDLKETISTEKSKSKELSKKNIELKDELSSANKTISELRRKLNELKKEVELDKQRIPIPSDTIKEVLDEASKEGYFSKSKPLEDIRKIINHNRTITNEKLKHCLHPFFTSKSDSKSENISQSTSRLENR